MQIPKPVLIIAEAGVNHNGDIATAKALIDVAAKAGVDLVKFQTFKADKIVSKAADMADYQKTNTANADSSQYEMLKRLELSHADHQELITYCEQKSIGFFSTAFDTEGLDYLDSLGFDQFKVPSGEITNYPYLRRLAEIGKPVILSTGMADLEDIGRALEVLTSGSLSNDDITVLHCNTEYPTPMVDVNLKAMHTIANTFCVNFGYSDHTQGIEVPVAAVALGAAVIEKHFTLSRDLPGPDHAASLEPDELLYMVKAIRNIEEAISGSGEKKPSASEKKNIHIARKSIHAAVEIKAGEIFTESNLTVLRPGTGISPMKWNSVIGKAAKKDLSQHRLLSLDDIV